MHQQRYGTVAPDVSYGKTPAGVARAEAEMRPQYVQTQFPKPTPKVENTP